MAYAPSPFWNASRRSEEEDRNVIVCGFADIGLYLVAVAALVALDRSLFGLWAAIAPLGFLMTCMPIGPVSAAYWSGAKAWTPRKPKEHRLDLREAEEQWIQARMLLKALECETVRLESEVMALDPHPEALHPPLRQALDETLDIRTQIQAELLKVDGQLAYIQDAKRLLLVCGPQ